MKNKIYLSLLLLFSPLFLSAQLTGFVNYEKVGISFTIPSGWVGQEGDGVIMMGHESIPGVVILTTHNYSLAELNSEAKKGVNEGNGTFLQLNGSIDKLASNAIGAEFAGTMDWQAAKAYILGVANPHQGPGVSIMAVTLANMYSAEHEKVCKQVFNSIRFKKIDRSKELKEWKTWLSNVKLTYMDSYYSSGYTDGSVSVGSSSRVSIDLCSKGYFNYSSSSSTTISGAGVSGYGGDNDGGDGRWSIGIGPSGEPSLILSFQNGEKYTYRLEYSNEELYLDGDRYFRTTEGEYAPNCN